jgi:hypothetical protein
MAFTRRVNARGIIFKDGKLPVVIDSELLAQE